ncbi:MAG TPA: twin-arginine translocase TatA/TatE family subunit [Caldilineae bacterium]|jgi:sec-independent protein translocase protein TatA|nr:twin-arginine translocase TatA/TatE family subunit [Caldilineae bacterium]
MPNLGPTELIIILVIVLAVFGAGRLPELGGAIGRGIRDFRKALREDEETGTEEQPQTQDVTS